MGTMVIACIIFLGIPLLLTSFFIIPAVRWKKWKVLIGSFILFLVLWSILEINTAMYSCGNNGFGSAFGGAFTSYWGSISAIGFIGVFIYYIQSRKIPTPSPLGVSSTIISIVALSTFLYKLHNYLLTQTPCWYSGG